MKGTLYGIGVGPGDPELLTVKAVRLIESCPVVAVPDSGGKERLALSIAQKYIREQEILDCYLPMTRDKTELERCQQQAADKLCSCLEEGKDVAFLTLGDPSIYATCSYLQRLVEEKGYPVVIVPGIASFCAAAAALGEPLCEGNEPLLILPAAMENLSGMLEEKGCKVIMKMGKKQDSVIGLLEEKGLLAGTSMVERCTLPGEIIRRDVSGLDKNGGYFSLLVVKGDK